MKKMNNAKSIRVNAIINGIQTILKFIFPLITFPYISRVLGTEQLGKYNFSNSFVSYFILLADFGVKTYAVREGAKIRSDKEKITKFSGEIFSINLWMTFISYACLISILSFWTKMQGYKELISILSLQIIFITLGRSWLFHIYEDFLFIAFRNILFQIVSMIVILCAVKESEDVFEYAIIVTAVAIGNEVLNVFISKKYCKIQILHNINKKHIKPLIYLLSTSVSITIYQSSDIIMLGIMGTDYNVGIYSVSVKIYNILKQLVAAILFVTIPRFSVYLSKKLYFEFQNLFIKVFNTLTLILFPISIGLIMVCRETVLLVAGINYKESALSLALLSFAMIFNLYTYMLGYCVLLPNGEEKYFFITTLCGAVVNVVINIILIPKYMQNAAAFSTIAAEASTLLLCIKKAKDFIKFRETFYNFICTLAGCGWIVFIGGVMHLLFDNTYIILSLTIPTSVLGYWVIQVLLKNQVLNESISSVLFMLRAKR